MEFSKPFQSKMNHLILSGSSYILVMDILYLWLTCRSLLNIDIWRVHVIHDFVKWRFMEHWILVIYLIMINNTFWLALHWPSGSIANAIFAQCSRLCLMRPSFFHQCDKSRDGKKPFKTFFKWKFPKVGTYIIISIRYRLLFIFQK